MAKVTGIGGIFFKCNNPDKVKDWYQKHLGLNTDQYGTTFEWRKVDTEEKGHTQWSPMSASTSYFDPSKSHFMVNYRVDNLEEMVRELKAAGVTIVDEIEEFEYGKFVHILDNEGNKIELWEPIDQEYEKILKVKTS